MPAAEVLRFPPPSVHVAALQKVRAAFYGLGAKEGFEVVRALPGIAPSTRAAAQWSRDPELCVRNGFLAREGPRRRVPAPYSGA